MGVDRIKDDLYNEKVDSAKLIKGMSNTVSNLLEQSFNKVKTGDIKIEDTSDILRLWGVLKQTTDYDEVIENRDKAATGALPSITTREAKALGVSQSVDEEGEIVTEDKDVENISDEDIDDMFNNLNNAMNDRNIDKMGD